jgi:hypothetical protein
MANEQRDSNARIRRESLKSYRKKRIADERVHDRKRKLPKQKKVKLSL